MNRSVPKKRPAIGRHEGSGGEGKGVHASARAGLKLRAPFPWFGGKSRAASIIWEALGDVPNYVEPFAGSLAILLGRPTEPRTETVNDLDCYLSNFWRALARDPEGVALEADWPVNEADLHARHRWLVEQEDFREKMRTDPDFFSARIAGWWVWGLSAWIGGGWCATAAMPNGETPSEQERRPDLGGKGSVSSPGNGSSIGGVHRASLKEPRPHLGAPGESGGMRGIHAERCAALVDEFHRLADRLRGVRVCCGDWKRVLTPSVTTGHGLTGIVLDPPYDQKLRDGAIYAQESDVSGAVREWAIEHGENPLLRIVLCGYEGEHEMPASWRVQDWIASGGYGRREDNQNRFKERLWLSPHCQVGQATLFDRVPT